MGLMVLYNTAHKFQSPQKIENTSLTENTKFDTFRFFLVFTQTTGLILMKPFANENLFTCGENEMP